MEWLYHIGTVVVCFAVALPFAVYFTLRRRRPRQEPPVGSFEYWVRKAYEEYGISIQQSDTGEIMGVHCPDHYVFTRMEYDHMSRQFFVELRGGNYRPRNCRVIHAQIGGLAALVERLNEALIFKSYNWN